MKGAYVPGTDPWEPESPDYVQLIMAEDEDDFVAAFARMESMMDFGGAIAAVKAGHKVQRDEWSGSQPGMYVRLDGIDSLALVLDNGDVLQYLAGPGDLLAEDWNYVRLPDTGDAEAGDPLAQRTYAGQEGPTIPQENIDNDNVTFVDTASVGPVAVAPAEHGHNVGGVHMPSVGGALRGDRVDGDGPAR